MAQSGWSLSLDVWSARFLAWAASWGREAELTPEAHAYFYDRYSRPCITGRRGISAGLHASR